MVTECEVVAVAANELPIDNQMKRKKRRRCGDCDGCVANECGKCVFCLDMTRFGGIGKKKKCCINRQCMNLIIPVEPVAMVGLKVGLVIDTYN